MFYCTSYFGQSTWGAFSMLQFKTQSVADRLFDFYFNYFINSPAVWSFIIIFILFYEYNFCAMLYTRLAQLWGSCLGQLPALRLSNIFYIERYVLAPLWGSCSGQLPAWRVSAILLPTCVQERNCLSHIFLNFLKIRVNSRLLRNQQLMTVDENIRKSFVF